jgi:hypothetical protein
VDVYLASPNTQQQAEHVAGMPVLLSYACFADWLHGGYQQSFKRILIDSGAYSELNSGKKIDIAKYRDWSERWQGHADAIAGLDDIRGDWRRSLANYAEIPWGFPTWHDSDPLELLRDLVPMARERGGWIGIGLVPPRQRKERIIREALGCIPDDLHVHGWALRAYTHIRRLDSVDSTNWWRDAMKLRTLPDTKHLTYGECLEIVVKRYQRWTRDIREPEEASPLFRALDTEADSQSATLTI